MQQQSEPSFPRLKYETRSVGHVMFLTACFAINRPAVKRTPSVHFSLETPESLHHQLPVQEKMVRFCPFTLVAPPVLLSEEEATLLLVHHGRAAAYAGRSSRHVLRDSARN